MYQDIPVVTDQFTKFTQAYATRNKSAKTATERVFNRFILRLGMPTLFFMTKQDNFRIPFLSISPDYVLKNQLITTPYYLQFNRQSQCMNSTILPCPKKKKSNWKYYINKLIYANNFTTHRIFTLSFFI